MLFIGENESIFPSSCKTEKLEKEWIDAMEVIEQ